jgi:hypothetical protein
MNSTIIEESAFINASPSAVYNVLADYRVGHLAILPKPYFVDMQVKEGGFGAGTFITVDMEVYGAKRHFRMRVTEPQKGRILEETDVDTGTVTQFIFEPANDGCRLTIHTKMVFADGFMGLLEKLTTPAITRNIYKKELQNIADYLKAAPQTI